MVGLYKTLLSSLLLATFAGAQSEFTIINPSSDSPWVAGSTNDLEWNCIAARAINQFGVLINNIDPNVFQGPAVLIAEQNDADCSVTLSQNQVNQPPGSGYIISFVNPRNTTEVYAVSQEFEIKPFGLS